MKLHFSVPALLALTVGVFPAAAPAAVPQTPGKIPEAPVAPRYLPFADEVASRHLLFAARDAYANAPVAVSFAARWTLLVSDGTTPDAPVVAQTGMETLRAQAGARRITLTTDTESRGGEHSVRRAIANGETVLVTRFDERKNAPTRTREYTRFPLDEGVTLFQALNQVRTFPVSEAGTLLLSPNFTLRDGSLCWRDTPISLNGELADVVCQIEENVAEGKRRRERVHRYTLARATHALLRDEQWIVTQDPGRARPATKKRPADNGTRVQYRREDYTDAGFTRGALPASLFAQTVPAAYVEKPLEASGDAPPARMPLPPDRYDPRALALLQRWRTAQERLLTLSAEAEVTFRAESRTADARPLPPAWQATTIGYSLTLRRPGRARVLMNTLRGGFPGEPQTLLAVSDGASVRAVEDGKPSDTLPLPNPSDLWNHLRRVGLTDHFGALTYLVNAPPPADAFDRATYEGPARLDGGEPVEVVLLSRETSGPAQRQRDSETTSLLRVYLGSDGLPRQIETRNVTQVSGLFARDQPPTLTVVSRFRGVSVDSEPPSTAFVLPAAKG